jgi:hypothetical protein
MRVIPPLMRALAFIGSSPCPYRALALASAIALKGNPGPILGHLETILEQPWDQDAAAEPFSRDWGAFLE